ncbi:J domain-containing protein [bacterium]|nr:J domain-containing protein [bacterium]
MINLYKILEVKRSADKKAIKKAYRKMSKTHHPDVEGGDREKFDMLNKAYKILMDDDKRSRYDNGENVENILKSKNKEEIELIGSILVNLMKSFNPETQDIIKQIDLSIDLNITKYEEQVAKLKQSIKKYKTFLKKLKHKKKSNLLFQIANGQIIDKKQKLEVLQKKEVMFKKAKKLIKDYGYDIVDDNEVIHNIMMNFTNGGASTG